jgi:hypothetical protein
MNQLNNKLNLQTATKTECTAEAYKWLDKALNFEDTNKPIKFIDMALMKAVNAEVAAVDGRK